MTVDKNGSIEPIYPAIEETPIEEMSGKGHNKP
jgi:hypothetical protein